MTELNTDISKTTKGGALVVFVFVRRGKCVCGDYE